MFSLIVTFYLTKTENRTKKSNTTFTLALSKGTIFAKKADFLQEMLTSAKCRRPWY